MIGRDLNQIGTKRAFASTGRPILNLDQVRLTYASEPFDLSIHAGEIMAVTGALGSGKSRLLGALFGVSRFVDGRVDLNGVPWRPRGPAEAIAGGVFMAGEDRWRSSVLPPFTPGADIAGTVALPHRRRWSGFGFVQGRREHAAARQVIDTLGIRCGGTSDTLDRLSGGNQLGLRIPDLLATLGMMGRGQEGQSGYPRKGAVGRRRHKHRHQRRHPDERGPARQSRYQGRFRAL